MVPSVRIDLLTTTWKYFWISINIPIYILYKFCIKITEVFCNFLKDIQKIGNSVVLSYILKKVDVLSYSLCSFLNQFKPIVLSICALCSIIWFMYWQSSFWCFLFTSDLERPKGQRLVYIHLWSCKLLVLHFQVFEDIICTSLSRLSVTSYSSQCCWTRMASQMIECFQFRCYFAEPQGFSDCSWRGNLMLMNCDLWPKVFKIE